MSDLHLVNVTRAVEGSNLHLVNVTIAVEGSKRYVTGTLRFNSYGYGGMILYTHALDLLIW